MKIAEVRSILKKYSKKELEFIITELYKAIPKKIKEEKAIDQIIENPVQQKKAKSTIKPPIIEELAFDIETFIDYAYNQYYFAPNRFVHKKERPKWRFKVKNYYKELTRITEKDDLDSASSLLEQLYGLLCYACGNYLFTTDEPFGSVHINQEDFFRSVLTLKSRVEDWPDFIKNAISLIIDNNGHALDSTLFHIIFEFVKTTDQKEIVIEKCNELRSELESKPKNRNSHYDYGLNEALNNLSEIGFLSYIHLTEYDQAIAYFLQHCHYMDDEVALFALLRWLWHFNLKDYWLREYEVAVRKDTQPRKSLITWYNYIKKNDKFPSDFL